MIAEDRALLRFAKERVQLTDPVSYDHNAKPVYTGGVTLTIRAHVKYSPVAKRTDAGDQIIQGAIIRLVPIRIEADGRQVELREPPVPSNDAMVVLPNGKEARIINVEVEPTEYGTHRVTITAGAA